MRSRLLPILTLAVLAALPAAAHNRTGSEPNNTLQSSIEIESDIVVPAIIADAADTLPVFTRSQKLASGFFGLRAQPNIQRTLDLGVKSRLGDDFLHARYYNPNLGRFLSVDPGKDWDPKLPQSWNLYAYTRNNPVGNTDPDGREMRDALMRALGVTLVLAGATPHPSFTGPPSTPLQKTIAEALASVTSEETATLTVLSVRGPKGVAPYAVGPVDELRAASVPGDKLDIHHAPQAKPAGQVIAGYNPSTSPGIALPQGEHQVIPTQKGTYNGTARDLVAKDIRDLRNFTRAPNSALQKLVQMIKDTFGDVAK